jgi:hypothetical protein
MFISERKLLLPVIATVSLLIALSGMRAPSHTAPLKSKFSQPGAIEIQGKETGEGLNKSDQFAEPACIYFLSSPAEYFVNSFHHGKRVHSPLFSAATPARASPSVNS